MTGLLGQVALSNLLFASVLAGLAYLVHRSGRHPSLAHGLWVVVLVKAITPPLLLLPILPGSTDCARHRLPRPSAGVGDDRRGDRHRPGSRPIGLADR